MQNIETYKGNEPFIFISYAHADRITVEPIIESLYLQGFRVWYDAGIEYGYEWPERIATYLSRCDVFLCFMSKNAQKSQNCRNEINLANELKKGK